jgi:hypothetical protein
VACRRAQAIADADQRPAAEARRRLIAAIGSLGGCGGLTCESVRWTHPGSRLGERASKQAVAALSQERDSSSASRRPNARAARARRNRRREQLSPTTNKAKVSDRRPESGGSNFISGSQCGHARKQHTHTCMPGRDRCAMCCNCGALDCAGSGRLSRRALSVSLQGCA